MLEKPLELRRRHDAEVPADAEPRRLEQRRQPEQQPGPLPLQRHRGRRCQGRSAAGCRPQGSRRRRASSASPAQVAAIFSYWRTTVPEWKEANDKIEALWKQHPPGTSQLADAARETSIGRRSCWPAATSSSRRSPSQPGVPGVPASADRREARRGSTSPAGWSMSGRRRRRGRSSTASGRRTSARAWSAPARISACKAKRRRIRSCSTGWRSSSWSTAGA